MNKTLGNGVRYSIKRSQSKGQSGYTAWSQVAGNFDGDGSVEIKLGIFVVRFVITWTDTYRKQLEHIADFLRTQGIAPSKIRPSDSTLGRMAWHLSLWEKGGLFEACRNMIPYLDKKGRQTKVVIDYLENRITGSQAIDVLNEERRRGKWSEKHRTQRVPWTREDGLEFARQAAGWHHLKFRRHVGDHDEKHGFPQHFLELTR